MYSNAIFKIWSAAHERYHGQIGKYLRKRQTFGDNLSKEKQILMLLLMGLGLGFKFRFRVRVGVRVRVSESGEK